MRHLKLLVLLALGVTPLSNSELILLKSTSAVCLDGSPGGFYHLPGTGDGAHKWFIFHQGGGWCQDLNHCLDRSRTVLGSSLHWPANYRNVAHYLSRSATVNPLMHNWNQVVLAYCDGASFTGDNATIAVYKGASLHFRGKAILDAVQQNLLGRGLRGATDVVISGASAGGLAAYIHMDQWADFLKAFCTTVPKMRGMPDSGFFRDYEGAPGYHSGMQWIYQQSNSSAGVSQSCLKGFPSTEGWKCIFAMHTAPFIRTPTFALQSVYDSWQVVE